LLPTQAREVRLPQVPENNCNLTPAEVRFRPTPLKLIVGKDEVAVKAYQTSREDAFPQFTAIPEVAVAPFNVPAVEEQVVPDTSTVAFAQRSFEGWAYDLPYRKRRIESRHKPLQRNAIKGIIVFIRTGL
jgi:hypothetical protein